ncbi:hypothetical protein A4H02_04275 [Fervidobacterium thailandense]|uniref:DUF2202 domain-containing protein n=2 Tax=Fervidobacterium thailandense TaxID=1008305 RepID=A0A1E3G3H0_9BACT|nr:hypothetical protein A4H02_04275 [Fervidobacterium thailandense]
MISLTPAGTLTKDDIESLKFMIQEEKLARDVYLTLYNIYKLTVFSNIAQSEQRHMDAVKTLLDKYGIENPLKTDTIGKYADPEFEKLYNELVAEGKKSIVDAINVGIKIEKLDIEDLKEAISKTKNQDLTTVFTNLMQGSENHLEAFTNQLGRFSQTSPTTSTTVAYGQRRRNRGK